MNILRSVLIVVMLHCGYASADMLQGKVIGIGDGDTVTVLDSDNQQWKIRLMGIDAPEKKQAFGTKSKESLSVLIYGKQVSVEYYKRDRDGRTIGKITVDGVDANLEQIRAGFAWHYKKYAKEQSAEDRSAYADAEEQARATKKGLWTDPSPVPPWEWRHLQKAKR
jgi:endonuclease YncB( thermonuclease family)